MSCQLSLRK